MQIKQADVIERVKAGETIIHVIQTVNGEHKPFQYLSGGGRVTTATYRKLTDPVSPRLRPVSPRLRPVSAGLFPSAEPQEWAWRDE